MKKKLLDISNKIDPFTKETLILIKNILDSLHLDFFVVGATARDLILHLVYEIKVYRKTNDIDFGIRLNSWNEYDKLKALLTETGLKQDARIMHRFYYKGMPIDFLPFGRIAKNDSTIEWLEDNKKEMNVLGFKGAYDNTDLIKIQTDPEVNINFASIEGLIILKLISWKEDPDRRVRDASDLYFLITNYLKCGNEDELFEHNNDIVENVPDYELAGARLLGRTIASISKEEVFEFILNISNNEDHLFSLASDMTKREGFVTDYDRQFEHYLSILRQLFSGIKDKFN